MTLEIIGAGFGRTGTDSMREALDILGFGPCHHMFEVTANPVMKTRWRALMTDRPEHPDWDALFEGYRSCTDWPAVHFWRALIAHFPEARVLLTWRDAESWWESYEKTLLRFFRSTEDHASVGYQVIARTFGDKAGDRDHVIAVYEAHVAEVMATVPADRLHVHRLGDGWESLCAFLDVPVPKDAFPHRNTAEAHARKLGTTD